MTSSYESVTLTAVYLLESTSCAGTFWVREHTRDPMGQPLRHMEQLLLVTSCDSPAGIGASLRTDGRTNARTNERTPDGQTDVTLEIVF